MSVSDALDEGRRATLAALRATLAAQIDGTGGHLPSCPCECGAPADARGVPALSKELRETIRELESLPVPGEASQVAQIAEARSKRRAAAGRRAGTAGS